MLGDCCEAVEASDSVRKHTHAHTRMENTGVSHVMLVVSIECTQLTLSTYESALSGHGPCATNSLLSLRATSSRPRSRRHAIKAYHSAVFVTYYKTDHRHVQSSYPSDEPAGFHSLCICVRVRASKRMHCTYCALDSA